MNARIAAAELLVAVMDHGRPLDEALADTPSFNALEGRDRAFARALVTAGLRRLGGLNAVLSRFLERPLPESATLARALLHLGAAQLLVLNTATLAGGLSGSATVMHDGPYGGLVGKAVALEPATGFSFDSPLASRPR